VPVAAAARRRAFAPIAVSGAICASHPVRGVRLHEARAANGERLAREEDGKGRLRHLPVPRKAITTEIVEIRAALPCDTSCHSLHLPPLLPPAQRALPAGGWYSTPCRRLWCIYTPKPCAVERRAGDIRV